MEQIASIEKLRQSLDRLNLTEDFSTFQDLITELHFVYQSYVFNQRVPELSDQRTLWDVAYYLLTALTNRVKTQDLPESDIKDGLAISGLVFELLGLWSETIDNQELQKLCFLNAAITYTLSFYEANSTVLANRNFNPDLYPDNQETLKSTISHYGNNIVLALLGRNFFWLQKIQSRYQSLLEVPDHILESLATDPHAEYAQLGFWQLTILAILDLSEFMFAGDESNYESSVRLQRQARHIARDYEFLTEHWLGSQLLRCYESMAERSTWRVLRAQGFSDEYIYTLARLPWHPVHEIWNSQLTALTALENPRDENQRNILSDEVSRAVVSMPTSAGKTLIAELLIVKALEDNPGTNCVYVAPSRALVDEIEIKLHHRLRFLGYRVASVIGGFELVGLEEDMLKNVDVAVLTPEKLDYLIRKQDPFISDISLIIFDEVHKVSDGNRGWFFETLISWIMLKPELAHIKMIFMSAVLPNTQQPLVQLWLGGEGGLAPIASNDWVPTRKLIGILGYRDMDPIWESPLELKKNGYKVYWGRSAGLEFKYSIGRQSRSLHDLYKQKIWVGAGDDYSFKGREKETRYDRCYKLVNMLGIQNSILVYFQTKQDLVRFVNHANEHLSSIRDHLSPSQVILLNRLQDYIKRRLGTQSPLISSLNYGVAFHHGDLPLDVRSEIELAYRRKVIRVLACTTTLAEGVNLPVQNLIIGYPQTRADGGFRLSVRDFKNIIGRAGRALIETEGKIIAIRHPEFGPRNISNFDYFNQLIEMNVDQMSLQSQIIRFQENTDVIEELNSLVEAINDIQDLARIEYSESLADEIQRLQVFIFSLFEDGIIDTSMETISNALQRTLLFIQQPRGDIIGVTERLSQKFASACSQIENDRLRTYNTSGLRYRSNIFIENLAVLIAQRWQESNESDLELANVILAEDLQFILENIYEARPKSSEYNAKISPIIERLDHYRILTSWYSGTSFASIRDEFFSDIGDGSIRTEVCQSYISKQFTYRLPWVFAALHTHIEKYELDLLSAWMETFPAQIKFGVNTPEAVYFSSVGIRSRFLAIYLANIYRAEYKNEKSVGWQSIEEWFINLDPFRLREEAADIPDLAIQQAMRRINSIRRPNRALQREGFLLFYLAGWQYYRGEQYLGEILEKIDTDTAFVYFIHEPENDYDEYAVSVHWADPATEDNKIGYVPREHNEEIAELLVLGRDLSARINLIDPIRPNRWRPVRVLVTLEI
ncbi:DEAD/DEAH box helicase [Chloroflexota bacterium]